MSIATLMGSAAEQVAAARGRLHGCPVDPACPYCGPAGAQPAEAPDWSFVDAVFCISLATRDDRMRHAAVPFHSLGLCRHVVFDRPDPDPRSGVAGCWEAHRTVALLARALGATRVLVFEDDVLFDRPVTPQRLRAVAAALDALPARCSSISVTGHSGCARSASTWSALLRAARTPPSRAIGFETGWPTDRGVRPVSRNTRSSAGGSMPPSPCCPTPSPTSPCSRCRRRSPPTPSETKKNGVPKRSGGSGTSSHIPVGASRPSAGCAETIVLLLSPIWCLLELVRPRLCRPLATGAPSARGPASRPTCGAAGHDGAR